MSGFHHSAKLLNADDSKLRYEFFTRHPDDSPQAGEFEFDIATGRFAIVRATDDKLEQACVIALVHKLKKLMVENGQPPSSILYVA